jgi:hypothetical protein
MTGRLGRDQARLSDDWIRLGRTRAPTTGRVSRVTSASSLCSTPRSATSTWPGRPARDPPDPLVRASATKSAADVSQMLRPARDRPGRLPGRTGSRCCRPDSRRGYAPPHQHGGDGGCCCCGDAPARRRFGIDHLPPANRCLHDGRFGNGVPFFFAAPPPFGRPAPSDASPPGLPTSPGRRCFAYAHDRVDARGSGRDAAGLPRRRLRPPALGGLRPRQSLTTPA